mmetsp:Transcript_52372/g.149303  ORF Transcript_52372/g.149303 Transcript_52372/m.149303 type:complete len:413 (+) Transcript_52372:2631-3869(+)
MPLHHDDDCDQWELRHERPEDGPPGDVRQGRRQGRGRDVPLHRRPDHEREIPGLHQRPSGIGRHRGPLRERREGRHPQRGPERLQGHGHPGHAREPLELFHRSDPEEPAHVALLLARGRRDAEPRPQVPGPRELHRHRLLPALARGRALQRGPEVPRPHRAAGAPGLAGPRGHPGVPALLLRVLGQAGRGLHRVGAALRLHHAQVLPGGHQALHHDGRQEGGRPRGPEGPAHERPREAERHDGAGRGPRGGPQGEGRGRGREGAGRGRLRGAGGEGEGQGPGGVGEGRGRGPKVLQDRGGRSPAADLLRGGPGQGHPTGQGGGERPGRARQEGLPGAQGPSQAAWRRGPRVRGRDAPAGRHRHQHRGGQEGQHQGRLLEGRHQDDEQPREVPAEPEGLQVLHRRGPGPAAER